MIGIVVIGYDVLPEALLASLQIVSGKQDHIHAVSLAAGEDVTAQRQLILDAVESVNTGNGTLVFVDSLDAVAGHLMLSLMDKALIEVVSGVNLPMLAAAAHHRPSMSLPDLAKLVRDEGRKAITWRTA